MSRGIYIGVDDGISDVAHRVNAIYIGVNDGISDVAHRVVRGYIGVGDVARPFVYSGPTYYGTTQDPLYQSDYFMGAATVDDTYAIFGPTESSKTMTAYDANLTRTVQKEDYYVRRSYFMTHTGDKQHVLITGGITSGGTIRNVVTAWTKEVTRYTETTITALSNTSYGLKGGTTSSYSIFAGGLGSNNYYLKYVWSYSNDFTYSRSEDSLRGGGISMASITDSENNRVIFAGGRASVNGTPSIYVDVVTDDLTVNTTFSDLSVGRGYFVGAMVGKYALFLGGNTTVNGSPTYAADAYNQDGTKALNVQQPSFAISRHAGVSLNDYGIFAGGSENKTVVIYNNDLTISIEEVQFPNAHDTCAATTIGKFALFGGCGVQNETLPVDVVVVS